MKYCRMCALSFVAFFSFSSRSASLFWWSGPSMCLSTWDLVLLIVLSQRKHLILPGSFESAMMQLALQRSVDARMRGVIVLLF